MPESVNGSASPSSGDGKQKKRRIPGACDICKRKKIRCDSGEMPDNRCSNCVQYGLECTHKEVTKTLGSAKGYVESLEARLEKMDKILSRLLPGIDITQEVDRFESLEPIEPSPLPRNDDPVPTEMLTMQLSRLNLNPRQNRFFGKSSGYQLIQTALDLKQEYTGDPPKKPSVPLKRLEFWDVPPWLSQNPQIEPDLPEYVYPPDDLITSLIDAYFTQINPFLPLLHRPTFEKSVADGLQRHDSMFASTLLLVCAHGARHSDDPRVLADGSESLRSAGWKWFEQVKIMRGNLYNRTTLHELQMHALHVLFNQSSETPQGIWSQIGFAVRLSQEVGAHRLRRNIDTPPTADDELWKRAFWVIMSMDRFLSSHSGRPCGLHDEDYDVDFPLECDDEYWETGFQQPEDTPSTISYFISYLKLMDILAYAMRLIYPIKRPNTVFGKAAPRSEQQVIAELDSAMNSWMDSVPAHLRWNPNCKNELFLKQSAALHATYYHLQIFIHRPFIPSPRNPMPVIFPSLAICTNAARSCCHVLESINKFTALPLPALQNTAFTAAVILLLNIWSGRRSGYAPNPKREMEDVQRCMEVLKASEKRWASAGRFRDILVELAFAGDVSIPGRSEGSPPASSKKRARDLGEEMKVDDSFTPPSDRTSTSSPTSPVTPTAEPRRSIAGTRRVSMSKSTPPKTPAPFIPVPPQVSQPVVPPLNFSLPMYSTELGRLPIYGQFNFLDTIPEPPNPNPPLSALALHPGIGGLAGVPQPQPQLQGLPYSWEQLLLAHLRTMHPTVAANMAAAIATAMGQNMNGAARAPAPDPVPAPAPVVNPLQNNFVVNPGSNQMHVDTYVIDSSFNGHIPDGSMNHNANPAVPSSSSLPSSSPFNGDVPSNAPPPFNFSGPSLENFEDLSRYGIGMMPMQAMDSDTMTMWSTAPTSFELDDWNTYISNVEQMTQGQAGTGSGGL